MYINVYMYMYIYIYIYVYLRIVRMKYISNPTMMLKHTCTYSILKLQTNLANVLGHHPVGVVIFFDQTDGV